MWRSWSDLSPIKIPCNLLLHLRVACQAEQCPPYLDSGPIPFPGCPGRQACTPGRTFGIRNEGLFHGCEGDAVLVRHIIIINNHLWSLISKDFVLLWSSVRDFSALLIIVEHAWNWYSAPFALIFAYICHTDCGVLKVSSEGLILSLSIVFFNCLRIVWRICRGRTTSLKNMLCVKASKNVVF